MAEDKGAGLWVGVALAAVAGLAAGVYLLRTDDGSDRRGEQRPSEAVQRGSDPERAEVAGKGTSEAVRLGLGAELAEVVGQRKDWDLDFRPWIGREAGGFVVRDIEGREHRLSDYRGRDVVVVLWATWCPGCVVEVPHLIALRKAVGPDRVAIIAISDESAEQLRKFAKAKGVNYTVAMAENGLEEPFASVQQIPTTFFIDPEGKVKLAAVGVVSKEEALAIINAGTREIPNANVEILSNP